MSVDIGSNPIGDTFSQECGSYLTSASNFFKGVADDKQQEDRLRMIVYSSNDLLQYAKQYSIDVQRIRQGIRDLSEDQIREITYFAVDAELGHIS